MLCVPALGQTTAEDWFNEGNALASQGKYDEAIQAYDKVLQALDKANPNLATVWKNKGNALDSQGKYDEANQAYDRALQLDPNDAITLSNKGNTLSHQGKYDEAIQAYDKAIDINPQYAKAWNNKGIALGMQSKYYEAIQAFNKSIKLDPNNAEAWSNKGNTLSHLGKYDEAIQACDKAIEINPQYAKAWNNKGLALGMQSKYYEAIQAFNKAIELDPNDAITLSNKGEALKRLDPNYEDAIDSKRSILNKLYHLRKGPYLIYPDNRTSMTVLWQTYYSPNSSTIEWGKTNDYVDGKTIVSEMKNILADHLFSYTITNLTPAARTYYKITVDGESFNGSFITAPQDSAKSLTFYAYSDSQRNLIIHDLIDSQIITNIKDKPEDRQTLCLHSGDLVTDGYDEDSWDGEYFNRTALNTRAFQSMIPVMACPGNHEGNAELFRNYLPYNYKNTGHDYYSFDYGPIHVAVLDLYASDFGKGSQQYEWLEQDLTNSAKQWKVIVVHEPLWSPGSSKHPGSSEQNEFDAMEMLPDSSRQNESYMVDILRRDLQPLFESNGVRLVLQGHQHYYSRCSVNGIQYLTIGGGGGNLSDPIYYLPQLIMVKKVHHSAKFDISGDRMQVTVISDDNTTIDSFIINANERFIEKLFRRG